MRKLVTALLLSLASVAGAVVAINMGVFQPWLERQASKYAGVPVELGRVRLAYKWPLQVQIGPTLIKHQLIEFRFAETEVEAIKIGTPAHVRLKIVQPKLKLTFAMSNVPDMGGAGGGGGATVSSDARKPTPHLTLQIVDGELDLPEGMVTGLNVLFDQKQLLRSAAQVKLQATVKAAAFPVPLPIQFSTDALTLSGEVIKSANMAASLAGMNASLQGASFLKDGQHRWVLDVSVPDLSRLPKPPMDLPATSWKGAVRVKGEIGKENTTKPWYAEGEAFIQKLSANLNYKHEKGSIAGTVLLDAHVKASYLAQQLNVSAFQAAVDLGGAAVEVPALLQKIAGVPFSAVIKGKSDTQKFSFEEFQVKLWNFVAKATGSVVLKDPWPADVRFQLLPVSLSGADRLLIPLRSSPVQGTLSAQGTFKGAATDPVSAQIVIEDLKLKGFSGVAHYEKAGAFQIRGPLSADLDAKGEWASSQVKNAQGSGFADLSAAALVLGPLRKDAKAKFRAKFALRNVGSSVLIDALELDTFFGKLSGSGKAELSAQPNLVLGLEAKPLLLSEMRIAMPEYRDKIPKGNLNASLKLNGKMVVTKPWQEWPLVVTGSVSATVPEYKIEDAPASAPAPQSPGAAPSATAASTAFLPHGYLTSNAKLSVRARVGRLFKGPLQIAGVGAEGALAGGKFTGNVSIQKIFEGVVEVKNLVVPLLTERPNIQGSASWVNLNVQQAIAFSKPEFKEFASGLTTGLAEFSTFLPSDPEFMTALKVRGDAGLKPITFSTVKVGQMINDMLAKVPMLKTSPAKVEPLRGEMKAQFDLNAGTLNLTKLEGQDENGSQIDMRGKVVLSSLQGDLVGSFAWAQPQVKGCVLEGNADAQGRLVIPLGIKGDLMNPGIGMLSDTAQKLAGKAIECEKNKAIEKAKQDGKKKIEKEIRKQLKGILGN